MSNIVSILAHEAIDPPALHLLGESYDAAVGVLEASGPMSTSDREALAFTMLTFVRLGVSDSDLLTQRAVQTFESRKQRSAQQAPTS